MLPFFSLHPDELLFSACARYHIWSRNPSWKQTMIDLFGSRKGAASIDFPNDLKYLCDQMPQGGLSPQEIIEGHTLFPLYRPFLTEERAKKVEQVMINGSNGKGGVIHFTLGVMASNVITPGYLRYCPKCIEVDREQYGEAYWHRHHQAPGVLACYFHRTKLINSNVRFSGDRSIQAFTDISTMSEVIFECDEQVSDLEWDLTESTYWILNNSIQVFDPEVTQGKYIQNLIVKGYISEGGRIKQEFLAEQFELFFGSSFLRDLGCSVLHTDNNWLVKMLRKLRGMTHPLRHILLLSFLQLTPKQFFEKVFDVYYPFGEGPWVCLNPAADHYKENVIKDCVVTRCSKTKKSIRTFSCTCGFVYARSGPDKSTHDRYRIGRIKNFGPVWLDKLLQLRTENLSNREIAKRLKVSNGTIKNQLDKLNTVDKSGIKNYDVESKIDYYREAWMKMIRDNPAKSKKAIRNMAENIFSWLYRYDREWLNNNSPENLPRKKYGGDNRVDWDKRDNQIAEELINASSKILAHIGRPIQITKNSLSRTIGKTALLQQHLDKLPKSKEIILKLVESQDEFQIRRVNYVVDVMLRDGLSLNRTSIIRNAGIQRGFSEVVNSEISRHLKV